MIRLIRRPAAKGIIASLLILVGLAFAQDNAGNSYRAALAAFRAGDLTQCRSLLEPIIAVHPDDGDAQHLLGLTEAMSGRPLQAEQHLKTAVRLEPSREDFRINLAKFFAKTGRPERGVEILSEPAASVESAQLIEARGLLRSACSDWERAAMDFARAAELDAGRLSAWYYLGLMERALGNLDTALRTFQRALSLRPDDFLSLLASGEILSLEGRWSQARLKLEQAEHVKPQSSEVQRDLSYLAMQEGDYRSALAFADRAVSLAGGSGAAHYQRARVLVCLERQEEAEAEFARFRKCSPESNSTIDELWQGLKKQSD